MSRSSLADLIRNHTARVAVIGQGYVGLPLAVEYARAGFPVTGFDTDQDRVIPLNLGRSHPGRPPPPPAGGPGPGGGGGPGGRGGGGAWGGAPPPRLGGGGGGGVF